MAAGHSGVTMNDRMNAPHAAEGAPPERAARARWRERLARVLREVDARPDAAHSLATLAALAHSSPGHFHRQFSAWCGLPLARYVQLSRLRRAVLQLLHRPRLRVLDVALGSGYESGEAFARAVRRELGLSPSALRREPLRLAACAGWAALERQLNDAEHATMNDSLFQIDAVRRVHLPDIPVALRVHRGPPAQLAASLGDFIAWRRERRLSPERAATYNLLYDDPEAVAPQDFRFGLAVAYDGAVEPNPQGLQAAVIPGGPHAVLRVVGPDAMLERALRWMYGHWLPASGCELADRPAWLQRLTLFPDVPAQQGELLLHLPLAG